ncbi:uncharacterized GPI-anchored protein At5g19250-like [Lotus japonicus]|uniref:uncharacterized GPI-anchored protein At5g19250-like n=1 Tax=Lotus japonicus TaxID=34305 RepID=UPI00258FC1AD|nr:uncharacterized GPI-anchored protein At5g19250-like [Lotus japonicus]
MASFKLGLYLLVAVFSLHLLPSPVMCGEEEKTLLHDINTYRKIFNLPVLEKRSKLSCLAEKIADDLDDLEDEKCENFYPAPGSYSKLPNFEKSVSKCKINLNTTSGGVVMPVCVPKLDPDYLFSNYTKSSRFNKYLNNSRYTIAGVGSEDNWMVLIISTDTASGDFSSATSLLSEAWTSHCMLLAFFSVLVVLLS